MTRKKAETQTSVNNSSISGQEGAVAIYRKSNRMINAKGRSSSLCLKLFAVGITHAKETEDGSVVSEISGQELRALFGRTNGSFYDQVKALIKPTDESKPSILDWRLYFEDDEAHHVEGVNIVTHAKFQDGRMTLFYNPLINKDIYGLRSNYTILSLSQMLELVSPYSIKLYEMLTSELNLEVSRRAKSQDPSIKREITAENPFRKTYDYLELRQLLGVSNAAGERKNKDGKPRKEMLSVFNDFRRRALDKAREELNEKTTIHMDYEVLKSGKGGKASAIVFICYRQDPYHKDAVPEIVLGKESLLSDEEKKQIKKQVMSLLMDMADDEDNISSRDAVTICKAADYDLEKVKRACALAAKQTSIHNLIGWLKTAIEEEYQEEMVIVAEEKKPKTRKGRARKTAANFEQREYDWDDLEKKVLSADSRPQRS